jgi:flagellar motor switch protein FliN/FliY
MAGEAIDARSGSVAKDLDLIGHVRVSLVAELGQAEMTVDELFKLTKQDIVTLNESLDAPVTLLLNGKPIARGALLAVDENLGVRITELL